MYLHPWEYYSIIDIFQQVSSTSDAFPTFSLHGQVSQRPVVSNVTLRNYKHDPYHRISLINDSATGCSVNYQHRQGRWVALCIPAYRESAYHQFTADSDRLFASAPGSIASAFCSITSGRRVNVAFPYVAKKLMFDRGKLETLLCFLFEQRGEIKLDLGGSLSGMISVS